MSHATGAVEFTKYHGTGNDFLVVDATDPVPDRAAFARTHCDRETGVSVAESSRNGGTSAATGRRGADGVLFLDVTERYSPARVVMTLVQPDGSTASMCGNGARCAAAWAHERTGETEFMIDTQAGTRHANVSPDDDYVEIEMGTPAFDPERVPVESDGPLVETEVEGLTVTAVNTGVPHAVAFVEDVDAHDLAAVAEPVRHADVFPEGANVNLASPAGTTADGVPVFAQRTFERGVEDETRSCGTGGVAIGAAAVRTGRVEGPEVHTTPPGGRLEVTVPDDGPAWLAGPVEVEYEGTLLADPR
ncbi:diaminopimelate epimerase [Haloparvum alkalitolerans]|uniref:diaminopimelate epimerase n=1 Tax=Haloparvum alkalitolerans TaxID=1042953 RepID=UPI003CF7CE26